MLKKAFLALLSAVLLSLPWLGLGGWSLFFAFVPLLLLGDERPRYYWVWVMLAFTIWNVTTTWWVGESTPVARFGIPVGSLFFTLVPFMIFHWFRKRATPAVSWGIFVTIWIAFEKLFMENEISFPWLTLGYGFMRNPEWIQWYEWTGSLGGSLWVLVGNILVYYTWKNFRISRQRMRWAVPMAVWILVPIAGSYIRYATYEEVHNPVKVAVVQPNLDPYHEKFVLDQEDQRDLILDLASQAPADVQFIFTPETTLEDDFWLEALPEHETIDTIWRFMGRYPKAELILGATVFELVGPNDPHQRWTRTARSGFSYNAYNSALGITNTRYGVEVYHKSKLVVGAELFPYPKVFGAFKFLSLDLGGISGNFGMQPYRTVFTSPEGIKVGVAICYESVYGEYFTEYIRAGAQFMSVITNDGWWGDTQGYKHHFDFARLRAVETRRSIARSANTGISGFINQRGDVLQSLGWDQEGLAVDEINLNDAQTFYVRMGDYIFRISLLVLGLCVLYYISLKFRKRLMSEE